MCDGAARPYTVSGLLRAWAPGWKSDPVSLPSQVLAWASVEGSLSWSLPISAPVSGWVLHMAGSHGGIGAELTVSVSLVAGVLDDGAGRALTRLSRSLRRSALPRGPGVLQPQATAPQHAGRPPGPAAFQQRQQPQCQRAWLGRPLGQPPPQPLAPAAAAGAQQARRGWEDPRELRPRAPQPIPLAQQAGRHRRGWQEALAALARRVRSGRVGGLPWGPGRGRPPCSEALDSRTQGGARGWAEHLFHSNPDVKNTWKPKFCQLPWLRPSPESSRGGLGCCWCLEPVSFPCALASGSQQWSVDRQGAKGPSLPWAEGSSSGHFFLCFFVCFIDVQLIYNVVLISAVPQSDSVVHVYILFACSFPLCFIPGD